MLSTTNPNTQTKPTDWQNGQKMERRRHEVVHIAVNLAAPSDLQPIKQLAL
jgi:hypothetical protein